MASWKNSTSCCASATNAGRTSATTRTTSSWTSNCRRLAGLEDARRKKPEVQLHTSGLAGRLSPDSQRASLCREPRTDLPLLPSPQRLDDQRRIQLRAFRSGVRVVFREKRLHLLCSQLL